jgi:hypothetical protein
LNLLNIINIKNQVKYCKSSSFPLAKKQKKKERREKKGKKKKEEEEEWSMCFFFFFLKNNNFNKFNYWPFSKRKKYD